MEFLRKNNINDPFAHILEETNFKNLGSFYKGKVRDSYVSNNKRVLISTDRLSAFDIILTTIPFKGQILNALSQFWFDKTSHIIKNHIISRPHANIVVAEDVNIIPIEVIVRGYLTGSAWRDYEKGNSISGIKLAPGLRRFHKFETPIITPSTKAAVGDHDVPISDKEIINNKVVDENIWSEIKATALKLFEFASNEVQKRDLLLVDTKYEFGLTKDNGKLILADEIHTQDCSRYWEASSYENSLKSGNEPVMLDKEFVRSWLISEGYMGEGTPPEFTNEKRLSILDKYLTAFERITGTEFVPSLEPIVERNIL